MAPPTVAPQERRLVPGAGLEPARALKTRRILSPLRLPIPPSRQLKIFKKLEAAPGFEPGVRVLQTHALPLGYAAKKDQIFSDSFYSIFFFNS